MWTKYIQQTIGQLDSINNAEGEVLRIIFTIHLGMWCDFKV